MKHNAIVILVTFVCWLGLAAPAGAFDDPPLGTMVQMTADCNESDVALSIDFTVTQAPDARFVGWIVEREVLGLCVDRARVTDVMPWPPMGQTHIDLTATPDWGYFDAIYRVWAVDDQDNLVFIYWPSRHNFAHAECLAGPTTIGYFVDYGGYLHFEACRENCWPILSFFDGRYPDGAADLAGTGELMALYGELFNGMEGEFIISTGMEPSPLGCVPVATASPSWGSLKAQYR